MVDYQPNSHKFKDEQKELAEKKVNKVVKGTAKTKKKSEIRKFTDNFISEDATNVGSYLFEDVIVPAVKNAIVDVVTDAVNMIFGTNKNRRGSGSSSNVSYARYYSSRDDNRGNGTVKAKSRFDFDDIIFDSRGDAEAVLEQMTDIIDTYKVVTVADMYEMAYLTQPYTSNKYGWTDLRNAEVVRVREGYVIKLPRALPID